MKKIDLMVLAPHEDDELAIAGPMIYQAVKNGQTVKVVFSTNGDYYPHEGPIRMNEALNALRVLGVKKEDVIFLGYGDQTQSVHLYNANADEVICAYNGNDETYGNSEIEEFAMKENGQHHKYTRTNFKNDMKAVLCKYMPKMIITTDWDNHMDHIALSLMLDECMGEILRENKEYHPLILKALAYTGKWEGRVDYYTPVNVTEYVNLTCGIEWEHPLNKWEDRIRFLVPDECGKGPLRKNILYQAACQHKSQNVDLKAPQFINQDLVFWRRHTEGLLYRAKIQASSGDVSFLNDFKCADCADIANDFLNYNQSIWITAEDDSEKCITIELEEPSVVKEMHFYENPSEKCKIENIQVLFDNGLEIGTGALQHDGSKTVLRLPEMREAKNITITIDKWEGKEIGLTEIEVYDRLLDLEAYPIPLPIWRDGENSPQKITFGMKLEEKYMRILRYARGRLWPDRFFLMKRYSYLKVSDSILTFWKAYIRFVFEKVLEKVK